MPILMAKKIFMPFRVWMSLGSIEPGLLMVPRNVSKATFLDHLFHIQVSLVFSTERHPNSRGDSTCQSQQLSQSAAGFYHDWPIGGVIRE